ncbi:PH domain-containing protein [Microbacterium oleivorans]|uniref:PH domain-containing protein n=1 Tax=Microbacterium oleivorans TaxID=273677 RepID=UPI00080EDD8F|nr:PH domain-containing protein [Microbacterium oleivorans]
MSDLDPHAAPAEHASAPPPAAVHSDMSDGEWHRMHPLSPLLRGGLTLIVIIGILVANLRDRLIAFFLPENFRWDEEDPVDFVLQNGIAVQAIVVVVVGLVVLLAIFWTAWRFHTFRITGDEVEVRSGVLFRTHRRAPLDRVQGVNLTRPALARLVGLAKLEVVGAGLDANVKLEYLSTRNAETVRGDILRLASGHRAKDAAARPAAADGRLSSRVSAGLSEIVDGVDDDGAEPESIVRVPMSRLILAGLLSGSTIWFVLIVVAVIVGLVLQPVWIIPALGASVPAAIGFGTYAIRQFIKTVRYSIAPSSAGVRITFGLLTTVTETLPPGRVHAVDIRQPLLWRWGGWYRIRVNKLSGRSASDASAAQMGDVLPIGTQADVERVLRLLLPSLHIDAPLLDAGLRGPRDGDGYLTSPARARVIDPLTWRRNGILVLPQAVLMRTGRLWPKLTILPLARLQSVRISQGPLARRLGLAALTGHTVMGPVSGTIESLDHEQAYARWNAITAAAVAEASAESSSSTDGGERNAVEVEWPEAAPSLTPPEAPGSFAPPAWAPPAPPAPPAEDR